MAEDEPELVQMLSNKHLQSIITDIDRNQDRFSSLEYHLATNKHFNDFILKLMQSMNYFDAEGKYIDPTDP